MGFGLTIWNAWKARAAVEQAREAAHETLQRMQSHLLGLDLGTAVRYLTEARSACRSRQWMRAVDRCEEARVRIARLFESQQLLPDERDRLPRIVDDLRLLLRRLESLDRGDPPDGDLSDHSTRRMDNHLAFLCQVEGRVQAAIPEI